MWKTVLTSVVRLMESKLLKRTAISLAMATKQKPAEVTTSFPSIKTRPSQSWTIWTFLITKHLAVTMKLENPLQKEDVHKLTKYCSHPLADRWLGDRTKFLQRLWLLRVAYLPARSEVSDNLFKRIELQADKLWKATPLQVSNLDKSAIVVLFWATAPKL